jgi:hypothetical protein
MIDRKLTQIIKNTLISPTHNYILCYNGRITVLPNIVQLLGVLYWLKRLSNDIPKTDVSTLPTLYFFGKVFRKFGPLVV